MTVKKIDLGPTGMTVAHNVRQWREVRRLGHTELSRLLAEQGHTIAPLGLRRIEDGQRRVDVGDLVALAIALNVSPLVLLLPVDDDRLVEKGDQLEVDRIWAWAHGQQALSGDPIAFVRDSNPLAPVSITIAGATFEAAGTAHYRLGRNVQPSENWTEVTATDGDD